MELIIGGINLGECVINAKRNILDGGEIKMRTLSGNLVSQYMYKKFSYEFEVDISIANTNSIYNLMSTPFQTVTYNKPGWNTVSGVICHVQVTEEDDSDLWRYQSLSMSANDRKQTVKIVCEEQ